MSGPAAAPPPALAPVSVNLFINRDCNYNCKFCFAGFKDQRVRMPLDEARKIIDQCAAAGTEKITFVGGEPTSVAYLPKLVSHAKAHGMVTTVVTNASRLTPQLLDALTGLDWLAVSIDSDDEVTERGLGRGSGQHIQHSIWALNEAKSRGMRTKLNTVVTRLNADEDMTRLVETCQPDRWKVFRMLPIKGENDDSWDLLPTDASFNGFVARHAALNPVVEDNEDMQDSYLMINPEGRIFQNGTGEHAVGPKVAEVGLEPAIKAVGWRVDRFVGRGGLYDWAREAE